MLKSHILMHFASCCDETFYAHFPVIPENLHSQSHQPLWHKESTNNQNPKQFYVDSRKWAFFILRLRACDLILNDLNTILDLKCELQHAKHLGQKLFCPEERRHIHVFTLIRVGVPEPQRVGEHLQAILVFVLF